MNQSKAASHKSQDVLAKVLATENLTVVHSPGAKTASFHTGTRVLVLPIYDGNMSKEASNMFIGHEVGHALKSPGVPQIKAAITAIDPNPKADPIVMGYLNVVEDARIERYIKNRYPGLIEDFKQGYKDLIARDFFRIKGVDLNTLPLIDRINLFFKAGSQLNGIHFTDKEQDLVTLVQNAKTWSEVVDATDALYKFAKEQSQTNQDDMDTSQSSEKGDGEEGDGDGSSGEGDEDSESSANGEEGDEDADGNDTGTTSKDSKGSSKSKNKGDSGKDGEADGEGSGSGKGKSKDGKGKKPSKSTTKQAGADVNAAGAAPGCTTQAAFDSNLVKCVDVNAAELEYLNFPTLNLKNIIVPAATVRAWFRTAYGITPKCGAAAADAFDTFRKANQEKINYLVQEFNLRKAAAERQREVTSRTGMIDCSRIYSYKFADDIFKANVTKMVGKNHALVYFIDFSGSMSGNIGPTVEQLLCLALFCRQTNIPLEVYSFGHAYKMPAKASAHPYKVGDVMFQDGFSLLQLFASGMTNAEFRSSCINLMAVGLAYANYPSGQGIPDQLNLGGWTPLAETAMTAPQIVDAMRTKFAAQFTHIVFLTDGQGYGIHRKMTESGWDSIDTYSRPVIFRDPVTKREFHMKDFEGDSVACAIAYARYRTNSNVIGFYCTGTDAKNTVGMVSGSMKGKTDKELRAEMEKNNFIVSKSRGYTAYYYIPGGSDLSISKKDKSATYKGMLSSADIQKVMSQKAANRKRSRVLLTNFIDLIQQTL